MNTPTASGMEWFTAKKSNVNDPTDTWPPPWISCSFTDFSLMRCSSSLPRMRPSVSLVPSTGTRRSSALSR